VLSSPSSSRPGTPGSTSSSSFSSHRPTDRPQSPSHVSPAEAAGIIAVLKDKRLVPGSERFHFIHTFILCSNLIDFFFLLIFFLFGRWLLLGHMKDIVKIYIVQIAICLLIIVHFE
jgi:hypothetical protein